MFLAATKTNASGGPVFVENVFSTDVYTGNGTVQSISNGIALGSSYGGNVLFYVLNSTWLTIPDNAAFEMAAGDFTIEGFFYSTVPVPNIATPRTLIGKGTTAFQSFNISLLYNSANPSTTSNLVFRSSSSGTSNNIANNVSFGIVSTNTWYHFAVARQGTDIRLFLNGALITTISSALSLVDNTAAASIGGRADGNDQCDALISNVRIVKGTAVYTSAFTPPSAPLTAISGTSLLTCQSPSPTTDYSSNAFTITVFNAVAQNSGGPFTDSSASKGGLVWLKSRSAATDHALYDTVRGATFDIGSNLATGQTTQPEGLTTFNTNGFSIGTLAKINTSAATYVSWTFREQPRFFDVVTYTGTGANRTVPHNLGSVPGCIFVKRTDTTGDWQVYHRGISNTSYLVLNTNAGIISGAGGAARWNSTTPTESVFSLGTDVTVNASGGTYVAYLFAHDAGGFGLTGTDNVITCGSYTGNGLAAGPTITLGYEPQWLLIKRTTFSTTSAWVLVDNIRGIYTSQVDKYLIPNATTIETDLEFVSLLPNGFTIPTTNVICNASGETYIYIAVRRGPMKTPTSGTQVLSLSARTGTGVNATVSGGIVSDALITKNRGAAVASLFAARLSGTGYVVSSTTAAEVAAGVTILQANPWDLMNGVKLGTTSTITNASAATYINYLLRRAPQVFDVVCYTGTGANRTIPHNLGAVPQLMIVKSRSAINAWSVYSNNDPTGLMTLNTDAAFGAAATVWNNTNPTASVFTVGTNAAVNTSAATYIAYLFATLAGVSKIGTYVGANATKNIDCGFTNGARFVLVKQFDAVNNWFIWDTARGISAATDPYWLTNAAAAEVTTTDWIEPLSSGFQVSGNASNPINTATAATWTARTPGFTSPVFINTGVFGAGLFAAGGDTGQIRTSPTGATWTARTSQFGTDSIFGLTFDNNQFVAVGSTGKISTSPTGATWTARTSTTTSELKCVAFGGGVWAALGAAGNFVCTSTDNGVTWTRTNIATVSGATAGNIVYGNGVFVSVGGNSTIKRSTDGVNWTVVQTGTGGVFGVSNNMFALTFAEGQFIAASVLGGVARSTDGLTWTLVGSLPANRYPVCFTYASGALYAAIENVTGSPVTDIYVSENLGTTWTLTAASVVAGSPAFLAYGTFTFMAAQFGGTAATAPSATYIYLAIA